MLNRTLSEAEYTPLLLPSPLSSTPRSISPLCTPSPANSHSIASSDSDSGGSPARSLIDLPGILEAGRREEGCVTKCGGMGGRWCGGWWRCAVGKRLVHAISPRKLLVAVLLASLCLFSLRASHVDFDQSVTPLLHTSLDRNSSTLFNTILAPWFNSFVESEEDDPVFREELALDPEPVEGGMGRWLVIAHTAEQETKAQLHLYDLALLARSLNRTLVVPQLSGARFGYCRERPFELYYAPDALSSFGAKTATHAVFSEALTTASQPPTAQVLRLELDNDELRPGQLHPTSSSDGDNGFLHHRASCLLSSAFDFSGRKPMKVGKPTGFVSPQRKQTEWASRVVRDLLALELETGPTEVLLVDQTYREHWINQDVANLFAPDFFPSARAFEYLRYADVWRDYASAVARELGPYVAVHWRMETLSPKHLPACGTSLVNKLLEVQRDHPEIKTVYLLMDYPIDSLALDLDDPSTSAIPGIDRDPRPPANSDTFYSVSAEHDAAMRAFLVELADRAPGLRWTTLRQAQHTVPFPAIISTELATQSNGEAAHPSQGLESIDRSLLGIVDKLVAARAEWLLTSEYKGNLPCGRVSSFAQHIRALRQKEVDSFGTNSGDGGRGLYGVGESWSRAD